MSEDQSKPDEVSPNADSPWASITTDRPRRGEPQPRESRLLGALQLLPGLALLLLLVGGAWLGWRTLQSKHAGPMSNTVVTADESCQMVIRILRELPTTKDGIEAATAQVENETTRVEGRADHIKRDKGEWARLTLAYEGLRKVQRGLRGKLEPFIERRVVKVSVPQGEPITTNDLKRASRGVELVSGPGHDLLAAVERYDRACQKLLELHREEGEEQGATWGGK